MNDILPNKRFTSKILILSCILSLAACNDGSSNDSSNDSSQSTSTIPQQTPATAAEMQSSCEDILNFNSVHDKNR